MTTKNKAQAPVVDEFGEFAKFVVIVIGVVAAIFITGLFIHFAAQPDLSGIDSRIDDLSNKVMSLEGEIQYRTSALGVTLSGTTSSRTVTVPTCTYVNGTTECH